MKTNILLDQMHVMDRDKELVISLVFDDHVLFFPMGEVHGFDAQIPADAVIIVDDIIAFLELNKIIERHIGAEDLTPRRLVGPACRPPACEAGTGRQDDDDLVLPDRSAGLAVYGGDGTDVVIFQVDTQRRVEIDRINVHDTAAPAELPLFEDPVDPAVAQVRYATDQFIRGQGFVNEEFDGLEHAASGIFLMPWVFFLMPRVFFLMPWVFFLMPWVFFLMPWVFFLMPWVFFLMPW